jgi:HEAT repeat protein
MSKIVLDSDRPASARKVAAKWLGEAEPDRSLPVLISAYESATGGIRENVAMDDFIREVVIQIGRFRSAKSIEVLEQSVRYPNPAVRSAGVRALGSLANREAIDVLEDVWAHDHDQTINDAALRELTRLRAMMDR